MSLSALPFELISRILQASGASAARCSMTCRRLYEVAQAPEVQYTVLLDVCEMIDSGRADIPLSQRLERLRSYEFARRTLSWTDFLELPCIEDTEFSITGPDAGFLSILSGHLREKAATITVHRLPSKLRGVQHRKWIWTFPMKDVTLHVEPSYGAAFLFNWRQDEGSYSTGHLYGYPRDLYTGETHPLALTPEIVLSSEYYQSARVHGMHILTINSSTSAVVLFNWMTGASQLIPAVSSLQKVMVFSSSYIIACNDSDTPPSLNIFALGEYSKATSQIATLPLPDTLCSSKTRLSLLGDCASHENSLDQALSCKESIFSPSPHHATSRVVSFWAETPSIGANSAAETIAIQIDIPVPFLMSLLERLLTSLVHGGNGPTRISWETLSKNGAAVRAAKGIRSLSTFLRYGSRVAWTILTPENTAALQVIDYSPLRVARARKDHVPILEERCTSILEGVVGDDLSGPLTIEIDSSPWRSPSSAALTLQPQSERLLPPRLITLRRVPVEAGWRDRVESGTDDAVTILRSKREDNRVQYKIVVYSL